MPKDLVSDIVNSISQKSHDDFFKSIEELKPSTQSGYRTCLRHYEDYLQLEYGQTVTEAIRDLKTYASDWRKDPSQRKLFVGAMADTTFEQIIIKHLQNFVQYLQVQRICPECEGHKCPTCKRTGFVKPKQRKALKSNTTKLKAYLRFFGLLDQINEKNIEREVKFPSEVEEEPFPLESEMIHEILKETLDQRRRTLYQVLSCSGLRIIEASALRKENFLFLSKQGTNATIKDFERIAIQTVPKYSKFGVQRTTFVSKEFEDDLLYLLQKCQDDQPVFVENKDPDTAKGNEERAFRLLRERLEDKFPVLSEKYATGTHKITIHSFRSFFITQVNKIDYGFGHALAGHKQYMARYNRLTPKEKAKYYADSEKYLLIHSTASATTELEEQVQQLEDRSHKEIQRIDQQFKSQTQLLSQKLDEIQSENHELKKQIKKLKASVV